MGWSNEQHVVALRGFWPTHRSIDLSMESGASMSLSNLPGNRLCTDRPAIGGKQVPRENHNIEHIIIEICITHNGKRQIHTYIFEAITAGAFKPERFKECNKRHSHTIIMPGEWLLNVSCVFARKLLGHLQHQQMKREVSGFRPWENVISKRK